MNSSILSNKQQYAVVVLSVMLSLMVVWVAVQGATTISTNVTTGGNLTVTGTSGLTGLATLTGGFASGASSTVSAMLSVSGPVNASSTLAVTGVTYHYGNVNVNGTATTTATTGDFATAGNLSAVGTLSVTGASTLTGAVTTNGNLVASSTSSTLKGVGVATSTPAAEFAANGSATTTLLLDSTGNAGGCIQFKGTGGSGWFHTYASSTGPLYLSAGACK